MTKRIAFLLLLVLVPTSTAFADLVASRVTVATTATLIYTAPARDGTVTIRNTDATASVYLGDVTVTTANGFELLAGAGVSLPMLKGEKVYGIVAASTVRVDKIEHPRIRQ